MIDIVRRQNLPLPIWISFFLLFALLASVNISIFLHSTQISKSIVFFFSTIIIFILYSIYRLSFNEVILKINIIDLILGAFLVYVSLNRYIFQPNYGFSLRYYELLCLSILYTFLKQCDLKVLKIVLLAAIIGGIIQGIYGNLQLNGLLPSFHSTFQITGSFFNPGPYSGYLASVFPIALHMYLDKDEYVRSREKIIGIGEFTKRMVATSFVLIPQIALIIILITLPAAGSRASWLAIAGSSFFIAFKKFYLFDSQLKKFFCSTGKKIFFISILSLIPIIIFFSLFFINKESGIGRLFIWRVTLNMIKTSPYFGHGYDRYKFLYLKYQADYFRLNEGSKEALIADNSYYSFNEFIQITAENGILGLLLVVFLGYIIFKSPYHNNKVANLAKAGIISISIFAFFSYPFEILPIKLNLVLFLAILSRSNKTLLLDSIFKPLNKKVNYFFKILYSISFLLLIFFTFNCLISLSKNLVIWKVAYNYYQNKNYLNCLKEYEKCYPFFLNEGEFLMNYGKALSTVGEHAKAIKILKRAEKYLNNTIIQITIGNCYESLKKYREAEVAYKEAIFMVPNRFYARYMLMKMYSETKQIEKAKKLGKSILEQDVKIHSRAVNEIKEKTLRIINEISSK